MNPARAQSPRQAFRLDALRAELAEKFPAPAVRSTSRWETGSAALDRYGGLPRGRTTEVCGSAAASQLLLASLLQAAVRQGFRMALIDGANAFEPADWPTPQRDRLLWVLAGDAEKSLKAADLLLRDGNLPVLVLDLQVVPRRQLRGIPANTWHRFHRVLESSATVFVIFTPEPMIEGVPCRIATRFPASLQKLHEPRPALMEQMELQIFERGRDPVALSA